jgi:hypothetical protein
MHETNSIGMTEPPPTTEEPWPTKAGDAEMGNDGEVTGTAASKDKSDGSDHAQERDGVNKTAIVVCSLGGIALLVAGIVIAIKRHQVEKDRSVYRPLMDDLHNHGFGESDPLH